MNNIKPGLLISILSILLVVVVFFMCKDIISIALLLLCIGMYFLYPKLLNLSVENPKIKSIRRINIMSMILIIIFAHIHNIESVKFSSVSIKFWLVIFIMIAVGNMAPKLPMNRYFGFRLPWTIRDDMTWRFAHKVLGYLAFLVAFLMIVSVYYGISEEKIINIGFGVWIIIPTVCSFVFYKKKDGMYNELTPKS